MPTRALHWCGVVGPVLFVVVFLVEGLLRPGYDPLRHPVSSLAIGPGGWVQSVSFLVTGALLVASAVGLRRDGIVVPVLVAVVGAGLIGAGLWTCDPINGYPPGTPPAPPRTTSGHLHDGFSALLFLGVPVACLVHAFRSLQRGAKRVAWCSAGTAVAFFAFFVLAGMGFAQSPTLMPYGGLMQRAALVVGFAWLAALALAQLRAESTQSPQRPPPGTR
ncbi:DUF998 domain-containing protein [Pseudonocardia sp. TRM90224]|uniref:DUF998 domain-containing protein n=1 Tax=Pseudonocardia sp. TRM90224 TaxID=2812678 RepID=UPI001E37D3B0|nr:DUF998 domain-containing protein [Pseudonocardia sp. TRM90224]